MLSPYIGHLPPSPCCKVPKCISKEVIKNYLEFIFRLDYFQINWHRESQVIQQTAEKTGQFCQLTTFTHTKVRLSGFVQTWNLSKNLQDRRFQGKKFTQKTRNFRHLLNCDKKCVNALNWDKTSKKSLFYQFILAQHQ